MAAKSTTGNFAKVLVSPVAILKASSTDKFSCSLDLFRTAWAELTSAGCRANHRPLISTIGDCCANKASNSFLETIVSPTAICNLYFSKLCKLKRSPFLVATSALILIPNLCSFSPGVKPGGKITPMPLFCNSPAVARIN